MKGAGKPQPRKKKKTKQSQRENVQLQLLCSDKITLVGGTGSIARAVHRENKITGGGQLADARLGRHEY